MSDVGQDYHTDGYRVPMDNRTNVEHDNVGIKRTFREVGFLTDEPVPAQPAQPTPKQAQKQENEQQKSPADEQRSDVNTQGTTNPGEAVKTQGETDEKKEFAGKLTAQQTGDAADENEDKKQGDDGNDKDPSQTTAPAPENGGVDDVCTTQLEKLIDDIFDGKESDKSFLAYCLDAQRKQWEVSTRHLRF